jgi:ribosomal protein S18 acetylase RimI-like enzyme
MIRPATPQDLDFITNAAHSFDRFGPRYVKVFEDMLLANDAALQPLGVIGEVQLFIHEDAGERTGFVAVEWKDGGIGDIHGVAVDVKHRRKGVANHLLDHVEQLARARGILILECITAETDNAPALSCFTDWGFEIVRTLGKYPQGQRAVKLSRTLNR